MEQNPTVSPVIEAPKKHKRTAGENMFDVVTYGGLAMGLNEGLSVVMINEGKDGRLQRFYKPLVNFFKELKPLNKLAYVREGRMPYILWGTIGGFVPVIPIKWLEDRKSSVVRWFDRVVHGPNADNDPKLAEAHATMDSKPPQTWRSLMEGRVTTVVSALAVDSAIGWDKALSTKLGSESKLKDYSSFNRFATTISRKIARVFDKPHRAGIDQAMATVTDVGKRYSIDVAKEGKLASYLSTGIYLLVLNLGLTMLFYGTSHMYANGQEKKRAKQLAHAKPEDAPITVAPREQAEETPAEKPATRIAHVENLSRVEQPGPSLTAGA